MESQTLGLIGGVFGAGIGVAGAAIGIYLSIKNTNGPRERSFMIKFVTINSILFAALIAAIFLVPPTYKIFVWVPYIALLFYLIRYGHKKQQEIRASEKDVHIP